MYEIIDFDDLVLESFRKGNKPPIILTEKERLEFSRLAK